MVRSCSSAGSAIGQSTPIARGRSGRASVMAATVCEGDEWPVNRVAVAHNFSVWRASGSGDQALTGTGRSRNAGRWLPSADSSGCGRGGRGRGWSPARTGSLGWRSPARRWRLPRLRPRPRWRAPRRGRSPSPERVSRGSARRRLAVHPGNRLADQLLDGADRLAVDRGDDGDGGALQAGAAGAADAVDVIVGDDAARRN